MQSPLNIINGDATLHQFMQTSLPGDTVVWREILSEGPVWHGDVDALFKIRSEWIANVYGASIEDYRQKVVSEYDKLLDSARYSEVILWFEFDLTCQINLTFLLNLFHQLSANHHIYLICPDSHPNHPDFKGLGELSPQELSALSAEKMAMTPADLRLASKAWEVYCINNKPQIETLLKEDFGNLKLLKPALQAHLRRMPDANGMNDIDKALINIVRSGINNRKDIHQEFHKTHKIFGMTDFAIDHYLNKLKIIGHITI